MSALMSPLRRVRCRSTVRLCPTRASRSILGLPPWVSAGMAAWRVGLRQISFVLLPVARAAHGAWGFSSYLQLWLSDERCRRITEAVNPANEGIGIRRVLI